MSGTSTDSLVCLVPVQCFFVCFVSEHMALSLFVFAMSSTSPRLLDCVHLILVCSAGLYCVPSPCIFAGSFWCLPVSWS